MSVEVEVNLDSVKSSERRQPNRKPPSQRELPTARKQRAAQLVTTAENEVGNQAKPARRLRLSINTKINAGAAARTAPRENLCPLKLT